MRGEVNESESFDVLIIGAGPAGSFAAERVARGGARVALFDGRPAREAKACGGGVTSKALKAWPFLLEAGGRAVNEVLMTSPAGPRVRLKPAQTFAIYFRRLDHISFGIATTQDDFDHKALDRMLWDFMVEYYREREAGGAAREEEG